MIKLSRIDQIMLARCEVARRWARAGKVHEEITIALTKLAYPEVLQPDRFPTLKRLEDAGLVTWDGGRCRTTDAGRAHVVKLLKKGTKT